MGLSHGEFVFIVHDCRNASSLLDQSIAGRIMARGPVAPRTSLRAEQSRVRSCGRLVRQGEAVPLLIYFYIWGGWESASVDGGEQVIIENLIRSMRMCSWQ